jgi:endonuclease/exonuclease/phosphatase family metal-dependent hydrolase
MKFRFLIMGLVTVLAGLSGCRRAPAVVSPIAVPVREDGAVELQLMSFNVRYETADDKGSHSWSKRIAGAVRMIRQQRPDCIGVQEALHGQAADLWASLPDYQFFGIGRDDGRRDGEYSGIFYQRHRFKLDPTDCGTFWLSDTPATPGSRTWGNEIPRVAAWVRLVDLASGRGFYLYNTHWDHRSQGSRERAAVLISQRIDSRRHADEPVALIGDFNAMESNPGMIYLTGGLAPLAGTTQSWKGGLIDAYQTLHPGEKNRRTLHFWEARREGQLKVDHILVSRGAKIAAAEIISSDHPVVSDHFPVTARILFPLGG